MSSHETTHERDGEAAEYDIKVPARQSDGKLSGKVAAALRKWAKRHASEE